jgi:hypothetical protein
MSTPTSYYYVDINIVPTSRPPGTMMRSTRNSAVHFAVDDADQDAEDVTAILNQEAATTPCRSAKKRPRPSSRSSEAGTPSAKRTRRHEPAVEDEVADDTPALEAEVPTAAKSPRRQSTRRQPGLVADNRVDEAEPEPEQETKHASVTKSPHRQSGRLQARKSLSTHTAVDRRHVFDVPDADGEDQEEKASQPAKGPLTRVRLLTRKPKNDPSPFKGRDIVETRTNARVNLDDSPRKRPAGHQSVANRLERIGKSLGKKSARKAGSKETDSIPFDGEDILATANNEVRDESPELGEAMPSTATSRTTTKARSPRKSPRNPAKSKTSAQAEAAAASGQQHTAKVAHRQANPLLQAAQQAKKADEVTKEQQRSTRRHYGGAQLDEENEAAANDAEVEVPDSNRNSPLFVENEEAGDNDVTNQPASSKPRAETEAQRRNAKRDEAAAEEERLQKLTVALKGVEKAVEVHDCRDAWADALVIGNEITEQRGPSEPRSTLGKACDRSFGEMIKVYSDFQQVDNAEGDRVLSTKEEQILRALEQSCKSLRDRSYQPLESQSVERYETARDLYEHLIPRSLQLAKAALRAHFRDDALDVTSLVEVSRILRITLNLTKSAQEWRPRPVLENQVKSKVASEIKPNVSAIIAIYDEIIEEHRRVLFRDDLAQRAAETVQREKELFRQKKESNRQKFRTSAPPTKSALLTSRPPEREKVPVRDIDEIVFDDDEDEPQSNQSINVPTQDLSSSAHPQLRRAATADIPALLEPEWPEQEEWALLNGLQSFTGSSRWDDIVAKYSCLQKYDEQRLRSKARDFKHRAEEKLALEYDESWDWLRAVPG